ncbi:CehA/McbA family metallohydrolase [Streptomyces wuyuanensis]|uniref:CehA/McbA family metallohydrolase n=1 Tax=Streptomyces wuyuanensis TaxID=1196353 RepID=UPI00343855FE
MTTIRQGRSPYGFDQWAYVDFQVPAGVGRVSVSTSFESYVVIPGLLENVLDIGVFAPSGFRGWSGGARRDFTLSSADATPGYVRGQIEPGKWSVALGPIVYDPKGMGWEVRITLEYGEPAQEPVFAVLPSAVPGRGEGWYRGDMHTHTVHSDGSSGIAELVESARRAGLQFIATTDHNTSSTGLSWNEEVPSDLLVINGEEVTTRHGHWLALGLPQGEWVDWRYSPADAGAFTQRADRVRALGGIVVAAHPLTPGPGSLWKFGYDHIDAMEVWSGPWTLDDAATVAWWDLMMRTGKRIAAVGHSDAHAAGDVATPHTVVHSPSLSRATILDNVRRGRSYLAESSAVTLSVTARCGSRQAGPGDGLPVSFFDAVDVAARVTGAPGSILTLHTEWGLMAAAQVGADGTGQLDWRGWGKASFFARAEVRRPKPGTTTLDQMVALSNPVWFGDPLPGTGGKDQAPPNPRQKFFHTIRAANGAWADMEPTGAGALSPFLGSQASVAGMPNGSTQVVGVASDGKLWLTIRDKNGEWADWEQLAGPGNRAEDTFREAAIAGMTDGTSQILATGMDGTLYHQTRRADGTLTGFVPVPGNNGAQNWTAVKVAVAPMPDGTAQVVSFAGNGAMYLNIRRANGSWSGWSQVPGAHGAPLFHGSALAITGMPDGTSQVAAIGLDGLLYHQVRALDGSWAGFRTPAGVNAPSMAASSTAIAGMPDGTAHLVVVGLDGNVWYGVRKPDAWNAWQPLAGPPSVGQFAAGQVRIATLPDGAALVVAIGARRSSGPYDLASMADRIVPFDYRGTGKKDHLLCYRPGVGSAYILSPGSDGYQAVYQGTGLGSYDLRSGADQVVPFDFTGSGKADHLICYRPGVGTVHIVNPRGGKGGTPRTVLSQAGLGGYDLRSPLDRIVPFDFTGSGKADHLLCYRPGDSIAWILAYRPGAPGDPFTRVSASGNGFQSWDLRSPADQVFAWDANGDGKHSTLVFYRPGARTVHMYTSAGDGRFTKVYESGSGLGGYDLAEPSDVITPWRTPDRKNGLICYRPGKGIFFIVQPDGAGAFKPVLRSTGGFGHWDLRVAADRIVTADYSGDGWDDLLFYRPGARQARAVGPDGTILFDSSTGIGT